MQDLLESEPPMFPQAMVTTLILFLPPVPNRLLPSTLMFLATLKLLLLNLNHNHNPQLLLLSQEDSSFRPTLRMIVPISNSLTGQTIDVPVDLATDSMSTQATVSESVSSSLLLIQSIKIVVITPTSTESSVFVIMDSGKKTTSVWPMSLVLLTVSILVMPASAIRDTRNNSKNVSKTVPKIVLQ